MSAIEATPLGLPGVLLLRPRVFADDRGWFFESYSDRTMDQVLGQPVRFVQDNHSSSRCGVLRGLHYQLPPAAQGKLVRLVRGRSFHAVVDIRRSAATFGRWTSAILGAEERTQLWVPAGMAHGLLALEDGTEVTYKVTTPWSPAHERSILWNDPRIGIAWPTTGAPLLSAKDADAPTLEQAELPSDS